MHMRLDTRAVQSLNCQDPCPPLHALMLKPELTAPMPIRACMGTSIRHLSLPPVCTCVSVYARTQVYTRIREALETAESARLARDAGLARQKELEAELAAMQARLAGVRQVRGSVRVGEHLCVCERPRMGVSVSMRVGAPLSAWFCIDQMLVCVCVF